MADLSSFLSSLSPLVVLSPSTSPKEEDRRGGGDKKGGLSPLSAAGKGGRGGRSTRIEKVICFRDGRGGGREGLSRIVPPPTSGITVRKS